MGLQDVFLRLADDRASETSTPAGGGTSVTDVYSYPSTSNILQSVTRGGTTTRSFTSDGAGNTLTDTRSSIPYVYTYNNANRLKTVTSQSNLVGTYTYNGFEQLIIRDQNISEQAGDLGPSHQKLCEDCRHPIRTWM